MEINQHINHQTNRLITDKEALNSLTDTVNVLRKINFDNGDFQIKYDAAGWTVSLKSKKRDLTDVFDYQIYQDKVTITAGAIHWGVMQPVWSEDTDLTLDEDYSYVYAEYDKVARTLTIKDNKAEEPISEDLYYRVALYQFRVIGVTDGLEKNQAYLYRRHHYGNIEVDANYGD